MRASLNLRMLYLLVSVQIAYNITIFKGLYYLRIILSHINLLPEISPSRHSRHLLIIALYIISIYGRNVIPKAGSEIRADAFYTVPAEQLDEPAQGVSFLSFCLVIAVCDEKGGIFPRAVAESRNFDFKLIFSSYYRKFPVRLGCTELTGRGQQHAHLERLVRKRAYCYHCPETTT